MSILPPQRRAESVVWKYELQKFLYKKELPKWGNWKQNMHLYKRNHPKHNKTKKIFRPERVHIEVFSIPICEP